MSSDHAPNASAAFEPAARRVRELTEHTLRAGRELREADRAGDPMRLVDAAGEVVHVTEDLARAVVEAGRWGDTAPLGYTRAAAVNMLLEVMRGDRATLPLLLDHCLTHAFVADDDPTQRALRDQARAFLVRHGWVTEHELATFPPASVTAIAHDRLRAWEAEHPVP